MNSNIIGNRGGIVYTKATQSNAGSSTTNAIYTLPNHTFKFLGPAGLIVVNINTAANTVTGIDINVNNLTLALTNNEGNALTSLPVGDYLISFNKINNTLKVL